MKTNLIRISKYAFLSLFMISLLACDSDDDLPVLEPITVNVFCYGTNSEESFNTAAAYNNDVIEISTGVFRTAAFMTDQNLTLDTNSNFQGTGVLMDVVLLGNRRAVFQPGTYIIDSIQESGNASVSYDIDFDSASTSNVGVTLLSGFVRVQPYSTGYAIEIDGEDENGDRFHGIFLGNVTQL